MIYTIYYKSYMYIYKTYNIMYIHIYIYMYHIKSMIYDMKNDIRYEINHMTSYIILNKSICKGKQYIT